VSRRVIKVQAEGLTEIPFGDSDRLEVGDFVVAIGNPLQLGQTVTAGIVSGLHRSNVGIGPYEDFIQTDAAIYPGNSGGALVNLRGDLVGINTAFIGAGKGNPGLGLAIPINMARALADQMLEYGDIRRGVLGFADGLPAMTTLRHMDDDFAEVRTRSHVLIGRVNLVEAEHFVDHWLDPVGRNGAVHRLEHLHRADRNALHVGAASQDQPRVEFGRRPAQAADQANLTADPDSAERARQRAGTADLDHVIDAKAAGEFHRRLLPVRRALVIDAPVRAEILRTRELLITRRRDDDLHAHRVRQLQPKGRDAAGALQEDSLRAPCTTSIGDANIIYSIRSVAS
jgi:hypothetical protein